MSWFKNYNIANRWLIMELTDQELSDLIKQQREDNKLIFKECLKDAFEIIKDNSEAYSKEHFDVSKSLFDKRSLTLYSLIENKLDEKIKIERDKFEEEKKKLLEEKETHE